MDDTLKEKIFDSAKRYYRDTLGLPDWSQRSSNRLNRDYEAYMFSELVKHAGPLEGKTVLDLGCGWGGVVFHAATQASRAVGIEPDTERLDIARALQKETGAAQVELLEGVGEKLPFPDNTFDIVASYQVLEHVQNPAQVMAEVARILKPGGTFHFSTPNYMAFYEPHYKVFWLPLLPKSIARFYLKLRGRKPDFLAHINYVNPIAIRKMLRHSRLRFTDLHLQSAIAKCQRILAHRLGWLPGWKSIEKMLQPLTSKLIFATHICFLNQDQEYLATKDGAPFSVLDCVPARFLKSRAPSIEPDAPTATVSS